MLFPKKQMTPHLCVTLGIPERFISFFNFVFLCFVHFKCAFTGWRENRISR